MELIIKALPAFLQGALITLELTVVAVVIGIVLGTVLAFGRLSQNKAVNAVSQFYIWFFRGSPLLLQIIFLFFGLPMLFPALSIDKFPAGCIALGLNSAAYLAEIIRGAIQSIDKGQMEASKALGMSSGQAMRIVIVPQSIRRLLPPVGNEFIALLKDSSLVSAIGLKDLLRVTTTLSNGTGQAVYYLPCIVFYLLMTTVFTLIFGKLERKYSVYE